MVPRSEAFLFSHSARDFTGPCGVRGQTASFGFTVFEPSINRRLNLAPPGWFFFDRLTWTLLVRRDTAPSMARVRW